MSTVAASYEWFGEQIRRLTGIDLRSYKSQQMERRLQTIMHRVGVAGYSEYVALLRRDESALKELKDFITINVSEFFRNPEKWDELKTLVLPALLKDRPGLRVWSAGCSKGMEVYSLAMVLDEIAPLGRHRLLASDLDEVVLSQAEAGVYDEKEIAGVDPRRRQKYFKQRPDSRWEVSSRLKANITFRRQNLLADPFEDDFDLIACRNVVIYFTEQVKTELYRRFFAALRPGGVLFVGGTESILNSREIGFQTLLPFFYQRPMRA